MIPNDVSGLEKRQATEQLQAAEATLQRRVAQLAILNEIGQRVTAVLDLKQLLEHAVTLIHERFDYHHVGLFLSDPASGKVVLRAKAGQFASLFPSGHALQAGQGLVGQVAQTGQYILANDVTREPRYVNLYPDVLATAAELSVPLLVEQTVIGVLDVQSVQVDAFDENDVMVIMTLAGQIAVAVQNAHLYALSCQQQEQTEILYKAAAALVETLEPEAVLERLLELVNAFVSNDAANLMLIEGERVRVARAQGYLRFGCQDYMTSFNYQINELPNLLSMQQTGQPIVIGDTYNDPRWVPSPEMAWLRSYAGVPLRVRGAVIGFLNVDSAFPGFFNTESTGRLQVFADQAAIALENAHLFATVQVERDRLNILYTVTRQLAAAATHADIAQVIAHALTLIGVRDYDLLLLDVEGKPWMASSILERQHFDHAAIVTYLQQILAHGLEAWVYTHRQTAVIYDTHQDPRWFIFPEHTAHSPVRAVICIPLLDRQNVVIGFLSYCHPEPYFFPPEAQALAEEIAARVCIALENARLYAETRQRLAREEQLNALAHALAGEVHLETLLARFLPQIATLTGAESATVGLYDAAAQRLYYPYHYRLPKSLASVTVDIHTGVSGRAFREQRTLVIEDYRADPDALPLWQSEGLRTALVIPLRVTDSIIGVLELYTLSAPNAFDSETCALAEAAAQLVGVALQRGQLFEAERAQRLFAESLAQAAAVINSSLNLEHILDVILEQVARVLQGNTYNIMLVEGEQARVVGRRGETSPDITAAPMDVFIIAEVPGLHQMTITGDPWLVTDTQHNEAWRQNIAQKHIRSYVGAPIRVGKITVGFINVNSTTPGQFGAADAQRLKSFADQAAVALENANLYQQLQDYANKLEQQVQKRTAQLQAQVVRSKAILSGTTDGIIVTDSQGQVLQLNPVAENWLHHTLPAAEAARLQQACQALAVGAATRPSMDLELAGLDLELHAAPITLAPPDRAAVVIAAHDITQRSALERMKAQFVSNVSHELRTPITTILLYAAMLQKGKVEKQAQYLQTLLQEAERQARLVEDVLQISRLDAGRLELQKQPLEINTFIRTLDENQQVLAHKHAVDFTYVLGTDSLWASADPERLRQILNNLLQNAFVYTGAGGRVTLSTARHIREDQPWAAITVSDTGIGIPEEELPHIFDRFFRGLEPRRRQLPGSGLGLAIVKELLELQGGHITVESRVGLGATFVVWLPLLEV